MDSTGDSPCGTVSAPDFKPEQILDFSSPVNPLGPSKKAERKTIKGIPGAFSESEANEGGLTEALARYHGLSEDELLLGAGATGLIHFLPRALSIRRALMVTPLPREYERSLEAPGLHPKPEIDYLEAREEDGFEADANGLVSALPRGYDALYLSNPGFPTGINLSREDLVRVLAQTERQRTWFILDETALDFREEHSLKEMAGSSSRLIILRSFSNFFALPGLRVGYLIANPEAVRKVREVLPPRTVSALSRIAAAESLGDQAHILRSRAWIAKERERLAQALRSIPGFVPYPGTVDFLLIQLLPFLGIDGEGLREALRKQGIRIGDCRPYRPLGPDFVFLALRARKENNLLIKALRGIVADLPPSPDSPRPG